MKGGPKELSVLSVKFSCEPETALKNKVYKFKKNLKISIWRDRQGRLLGGSELDLEERAGEPDFSR